MLTKRFYENSIGVVIGIDKYLDSDQPELANSVNDAKSIGRMLKELDFDEVIECYDERANKSDIISLFLDQLPNKLGQEDRLLVFFAGHAITKESRRNRSKLGYIIPYDGSEDRMSSLIEFNDLVKKTTDHLMAKHILFLMDCCFSGIATLRTGSPDIIPTMDLEIQIERLTQRNTIQVITAGSEDETVLDEGTLKTNSPFTSSIIHGLESFDADLDKNGIITSSELWMYLADRVSQMANVYGHKQRPLMTKLPGDGGGEFILKVSNSFLKYTNENFQKQIAEMPTLHIIDLIRDYTHLRSIKSLIIGSDIVCLSYTSFSSNIKELQHELILALTIMGKMFNPIIGFKVIALPPNEFPVDVDGNDKKELLTIEVGNPFIREYLKNNNLKELWSKAITYQKTPNWSNVKTTQINLNLEL